MDNAAIDDLASPAIGDRYKQRCMGSPVWEIARFFTDPKGIEHVQLREIDNRLDLKTLALLSFMQSPEFLKLSA